MRQPGSAGHVRHLMPSHQQREGVSVSLTLGICVQCRPLTTGTRQTIGNVAGKFPARRRVCPALDQPGTTKPGRGRHRWRGSSLALRPIGQRPHPATERASHFRPGARDAPELDDVRHGVALHHLTRWGADAAPRTRWRPGCRSGKRNPGRSPGMKYRSVQHGRLNPLKP